VGAERIAAALRRLTADPRLNYHGKTPCKVLRDRGKNRLDVQPDDDRLPPMANIPLRTFAPGVTLEVKAGARVQLAFEDGDPARPVLELFETGSIRRLIVPADLEIVLGGQAGALEVVRRTDPVEVTIYVAPSLLGKISAGPSVEPQPIGPPLPFVPVTVGGTNTGGSRKVKASS
jgi:hypothetical protein